MIDDSLFDWACTGYNQVFSYKQLIDFSREMRGGSPLTLHKKVLTIVKPFQVVTADLVTIEYDCMSRSQIF